MAGTGHAAQVVRSAVKDLLSMVDHPYVMPVRDVDFTESSQDKSWLVLMHPLQPQGSLKDVIANDSSA